MNDELLGEPGSRGRGPGDPVPTPAEEEPAGPIVELDSGDPLKRRPVRTESIAAASHWDPRVWHSA